MIRSLVGGFFNLKDLGRSGGQGGPHCGSTETNCTSIHEDASLIPGLVQWLKDLTLLWLGRRPAVIRPPSLGTTICHRCSPEEKKKKKKINRVQERLNNFSWSKSYCTAELSPPLLGPVVWAISATCCVPARLPGAAWREGITTIWVVPLRSCVAEDRESACPPRASILLHKHLEIISDVSHLGKLL